MRNQCQAITCLLLIGLLLVSLACAQPKSTTAEGGPFAGKTVTLVVTFAPGGATDIVGRIYAKYLSKHLEGKPTVVVRNIPGGAGTIGANYVYSAKPDGLTIMIATASNYIGNLMNMKAANYDLLKMPTLIGYASGNVFYMAPGIIEKPEDILKAKGLIFGSSTGVVSYAFIAAKELLGIPTEKVILGYAGSGDARRAFLSRETNFTGESTPGYREAIAPLVEKREVMPVFQLGLLSKGDIIREPGLPPDTPTVKELYEKLYGKPPSGMAWEAYKGIVGGTRNYDKTLHLPPGTPDNIADMYWTACENMLNDPEFRNVVNPVVGEDALWGAGEAYDKEFKLNFRMDPKAVEWFTAIMPKYGVVLE